MAQQRRRREREPVLDDGYWFDEDLRIVEHLGGSRKVDVYLCHSVPLKTLVTCKVLRPEYRIDFSSLQAVLDEGDILLRLRHPNVVEGYGVELEDHPRIVMEHLEGETITSAFFSGNYQAFNLGDAVNVARDVASALTYVHEQGYLHLDVKPSNVMYHNGHATLFDFSVAEEYSPDETLRNDAGTTEYMAPEQTYRREVGYYTDVFGVGVLLYRLLSGGELPYELIEVDDEDEEGDGKTKRQLAYDIAPLHPSIHNPQVSQDLGDVALTAVSGEISEQYATPQEFADALLLAAEDLLA
jgi:serine/threonine protein kinase